jgi:hypothetical protein
MVYATTWTCDGCGLKRVWDDPTALPPTRTERFLRFFLLFSLTLIGFAWGFVFFYYWLGYV